MLWSLRGASFGTEPEVRVSENPNPLFRTLRYHARMTKQIFTIGYEGADMDRFLTTLKDAGVATLADVRAVALSLARFLQVLSSRRAGGP